MAKIFFKLLMYIFFALVFLIFQTSCSEINTPSKKHKEELLRQNLQNLDIFKIEGFAEFNYKELVFRKKIYIAKNHSDVKAIIIDGGVFGMNPTPFLQFTIDNNKIIIQKNYETIFTQKMESLAQLLDLSFFYKNQKEIFAKRKIKVNNVEILFNKKYQIYRIINDSIDITLHYNTNKLSKITILKNNSIIGKIENIKFKD